MATCSGQNFIELLRKVNYPDISALDASNFDWMFEEKDLIPFLETLCFDVEDENILSTEEITQYKEFQENEFTDCSKIEKLKTKEFTEDENEIKENIARLHEDIAASERYVELLEIQRDKLSVHQLGQCENIEKLERQKKFVEKEIMKTRGEILPVAVNKLTDVVRETSDRIKEANFSLKQSSDVSSKPGKALFQVSIKPYLDSEMKTLENMNNYLNDSFKKCVTHVNNSVIEDTFIEEQFSKVLTSKNHQIKLAENALLLRDMRQTTCGRYLKSAFEENKMEAQMKFLNDFVEKNDLNSYMLSIPHLQNKITMVNGTLLELEKEKEQLLQRLSSVIQEHLNTKFNWIAILCSKEKLERYKSYLELLEKPLDILYDQRARLEFLNIAMAIEENNLDKLKNNLQSFVEKLENEVNDSQNRLNIYTKKPEEIPQDNIYVRKNSILYSLNQIMDIFGNESNHQMAYLTISDVFEKATKLKSQEDDVIQRSESVYQEQMQLVKAAEENAALFEKYLKLDENSFEEHPFLLIDKFTMKIGSLSLELKLFQEKFLKEMNNYNSKKGMISKNNNIALMRRLYVYALTNPPKFARAIKEVKDRIESYERKKKMIKSVHK